MGKGLSQSNGQRDHAMTTTIEAIYEKGVLRPLTPLSLPEGQHVQVSVASEEPAQPQDAASILRKIASLPVEGSGRSIYQPGPRSGTLRLAPSTMSDLVFVDTMLGLPPCAWRCEPCGRRRRLATVHYLTPEEIHAAWQVFQRLRDKNWSFTDCTSKVVMERLGCTRATAFDDHFRQSAPYWWSRKEFARQRPYLGASRGQGISVDRVAPSRRVAGLPKPAVIPTRSRWKR